MKTNPNKIVRAVSDVTKVTAKQIFGQRGQWPVCWARFMAVYLVREHTGWPYSKVAEYFGRDCGTVQHACRRVKEECDINAQAVMDLKQAEDRL